MGHLEAVTGDGATGGRVDDAARFALRGPHENAQRAPAVRVQVVERVVDTVLVREERREVEDDRTFDVGGEGVGARRFALDELDPWMARQEPRVAGREVVHDDDALGAAIEELGDEAGPDRARASRHHYRSQRFRHG